MFSQSPFSMWEMIPIRYELYPVRDVRSIKLYSNAYDDPVSRESGAFTDMMDSIDQAKHTILIAGWSVSITDVFGRDHKTLLQRLLEKVRQGVNVLLLVWENVHPEYSSSHESLLYHINKALGQLSKPERKKMINHLHLYFSERTLGYSDHHKMVVADDVLYLGGLDLTHGRSNSDVWHDCHARLGGGCVLDAVDYFEGRWLAIDKVSPSLLGCPEAAKIALADLKDRLAEVLHAVPDNNSDACIQFITSSQRKHTTRLHWYHEPHRLVSSEIQDAYLAAIRRAEKFIYIENQFFIGPRFEKGQMVASPNRVITALFEKIRQKIENNDNFHLYLQIPFRPGDGEEDSIAVQVVLHAQWETLYWLIQSIHRICEQANQGRSVSDYLTLYQLGRMTKDGYVMKYTHSKLMIVDDVDLIIGSANCNERSMVGDRDAEIAVHLMNHPAVVRDFRHRLMCEHFGVEFMRMHDQLIAMPESEHAYRVLQGLLDSNVLKMQNGDSSLLATFWGSQSSVDLYKAVRPPHVAESPPVIYSMASSLSEYVSKMPK